MTNRYDNVYRNEPHKVHGILTIGIDFNYFYI